MTIQSNLNFSDSGRDVNCMITWKMVAYFKFKVEIALYTQKKKCACAH